LILSFLKTGTVTRRTILRISFTEPFERVIIPLLLILFT
jgi:hypothetical protein